MQVINFKNIHLAIPEPPSKFKKKYYTPQFSEMAHNAIQRLGWALNASMVRTVDELVAYLPRLVDKSKICPACKDKKGCGSCIFSGSSNPQSVLPQVIG
jgi:hypothetical protein